MKYYIKYQIKYQLIYEMLYKLNKRKINFFIDLQSIAKGFYNKEVVLVEIGRYATEGKISDILIYELKDFLNGIYNNFRQFDPFFVLFYDDGYCSQQKSIDSSYKSGRSTLQLLMDNDQEIELFRHIKKYYFQKIKTDFTKPDLCDVYYLNEYEADFIPHYCVTNGLYDSDSNEVLNVILSIDKDLLQTCKFNNTIQCITSFVKDVQKGGFKINFETFDNDNAICYINKKFKRGILTAESIPMILAIAGDKSDGIEGIRGIGRVKASELIINHDIPLTIKELKLKLDSMPDIIKNNFKLIEKNYKMISFDEQLSRVPKKIFII